MQFKTIIQYLTENAPANSGPFQSLIILKNGTARAIFQHNTIAFDAEGRQLRGPDSTTPTADLSTVKLNPGH